MKKTSLYLIFLSCVAILFMIFSNLFNSGIDRTTVSKETVKDEDESNQMELEYEDRIYRLNWFIVDDYLTIDLHSNLKEKLPSGKAYIENDCKYLVNGGFYDIDNTHLGLFIEGGETISTTRDSNTFNSYLSIYPDQKISITTDQPAPGVHHALQTGPLLIKDSVASQLGIENDKFARRVVAFETIDNRPGFVIISDKNTGVSGPMLSDIPELLDKFQETTDINISDATNLDGGGASAYITTSSKFTESQPIGSYFCVR